MSLQKQLVTDTAKLEWRTGHLRDPSTRKSACFVSTIKKLKFRLYFGVHQNKTRVSLRCMDEYEQLRIRYCITMQSCASMPYSQVFEYDATDRSKYNHFTAAQLCASSCPFGCGQIVCTVEIIENFSTDKVDEELKDLSADFGSLFASGTLSDMTLSAGGKDFRVHKIVLAARSQVFGAMFENKNSKEVQEGKMSIEDMSSDVCGEMLKHIYTGHIPSHISEYAFDLFVAADKYQLTMLKSVCEGALLNLLNINSVSNVLLIADGCKAAELKLKCIDFIIDNSVEVMKTEGWKQIAVKNDLLVELFGYLSQKYRSNHCNKRLKVV